MNNKKAQKLIDRKRNTDGSPFEDTMILPASGGRAARCQATTKAGEQCGKAAREGYTVCSSHGAGTHRREQNGSRQKPGRPATRGRYSATASQRIREFAEEMRALGVDHWDDIDELLVLRAALKWSLERQEFMDDKRELLEGAVPVLEEALDAFQQAFEASGGTDVEARVLVRVCGKALRDITVAQAQHLQWVDEISRLASSIIKAQKDGADARFKRSDAKALEQFTLLLKVTRPIIFELLGSSEKIELFEQRLKAAIAPLLGKSASTDELN